MCLSPASSFLPLGPVPFCWAPQGCRHRATPSPVGAREHVLRDPHSQAVAVTTTLYTLLAPQHPLS